MRREVFAAAAVLTMVFTAAAKAPDVLDITDKWQCQPLDSKKLAQDKAPKDKIPMPSEEEVTRAVLKTDAEDGMPDLDGDLDGLDLDDTATKRKKGGAAEPSAAAGLWQAKRVNLRGMLEQVPTDRYKVKGDPELDLNCVKKSNFNVWYRRKVDVPAEWKGFHVTFDVEVQYIELALFVNGKLAGRGGTPSVRIDVTDYLKYGETNEIRVFFSSQGYGTGPGIIYQGRDETVQRHFESGVRLTRRGSAIVDGYWADTSWRKGEIALQCEIYSFERQRVKVAADIIEDAGRGPKGDLLGTKVVKRLAGEFDLDVGTNVVRVVQPWKDAKTWEVDRPFLYNCDAVVTDAKGARVRGPGKFVFGFREVWREGKDIMLNGHLQHYRGFWGPGPKKLADMKKHGFNCISATHQHASRYTENEKELEELSRAGIVKLTGTPSITSCVGSMNNPICQEQFRRFCLRWARSCRNWPCVHGASVGVNMMCAAKWTMGARDFGRHRTESGNIGLACGIAHEYHPNALYYAHGDGNVHDVGTCNFYFNWTPLQEREEWLETWSKIGEIPCYPAEFGAPYYGSWFPQPAHSPAMTELCAIYLGDRSYELEDPRMLEHSRAFAYSSAATYYSGTVREGPDRELTLFDLSEAGREVHALLVERVTRSWRMWGQAINPMYLDVLDWEGWEKGFELKSHRRYNGLCVAYIGGRPWHTDKTRAYYGGERVEKCFAYVWDGAGENTFRATWQAAEKGSGKVLASGAVDTAMKPGEIKCVPFGFDAPKVSRRTTYVITAKFDARDIDDTTVADSFEVEVYPPLEKLSVPSGKSIALFDPRGESAQVLDRLGLAYEKVRTLDELVGAKATHLVVGRRALDGMGDSNRVERLAAKAAEGRHVMVMAQYPSTWQKLGFKIEDCMPRQLWNTFLPGLDERDLSFWRGLPLPMRDGSAWEYGADWGHVQEKTNGSRLWRWYHTHTLASEVFQISTRTLYRPLVRGEFDMMYTPLMRAVSGSGSTTMCAFDFYRHLLGSDDYVSCPSAELVARTVFADYLADRAEATAKVFTDGAQAKRLADALGLDSAAWDGKRIENAVLISGADAAHGYDDVKGALGRDAHALVVESEAFPAGAGFKLEMPRGKKVEWKQETINPYQTKEDLKKLVGKSKPAANLDEIENPDSDISLDETEEVVEKPVRPKWMTDAQLEKRWVATTGVVDICYLNTRDTANFGKLPFAGVGPQHLRWRWYMPIKRLQPLKGWTLAGDGVFAISDDGKVLIDMMKPFQLTDERREKKDSVGLYNVSLSQDNQFRRYSLVLENWGVRPSDTLLRRSLTLPRAVAKGEKEPTMPNLYWTECPNYDPYWFCLW